MELKQEKFTSTLSVNVHYCNNLIIRLKEMFVTYTIFKIYRSRDARL